MITTAKGIAALLLAAAVWVNANVGVGFYVLAGMLIVDALINRKEEAAFWHRVAAQLVSLAAATYMGGHIGVDGVRLVLAGLVAWEMAALGGEVSAWIQRGQAKGTITPAEALALRTAQAQIEARLKQLESANG